MPRVAIRVAEPGPEPQPVADRVTGGQVEEAQRERLDAQRGAQAGARCLRAQRGSSPYSPRPGPDGARNTGGAGQDAARRADVDEARIDPGRTHRVERAGQAQELDLGVGVVLARYGEVADRARKLQARASGDARGQGHRLGSRGALPAQARIDLQVDAEARGAGGRLEQAQRALVVHDRLEASSATTGASA